MFLALFRMVEAESGSIVIDGIDIATMGLLHLRSKMSIIPQVRRFAAATLGCLCFMRTCV